MKLREIREIANDTGVLAERAYNLKNFANRIVELDRQQRTWVGLTEDEAFACRGRDYFETYKAIEAKLKEKNT